MGPSPFNSEQTSLWRRSRLIRAGLPAGTPIRGAIIVVKTGTLNVYRSVGSQCQTETYSAGQAFIERPGELDNVLNMSSSPYVLYVTFPRVPQGVSPRTDELNTGTCPGVGRPSRGRRPL